jgi:PEP-CTERM motif
MPFSNRVQQHLVRRWRTTCGVVAACLVLLLLVILSRLDDLTLPGVLPPGAFDPSQQSQADDELSPHAALPSRNERVSQLLASLKTGGDRLLADPSILDFDLFALQTGSEHIALFDESAGVLARCDSCGGPLFDETQAHTFSPDRWSLPVPGYVGVGSRSGSKSASGAGDSGGSGSSGFATSGGSGALGGGSSPGIEIPPPPSSWSSGGSTGDGPSYESNDSHPTDHRDGAPMTDDELHSQWDVDQNHPTHVPEPSTVLLAALGIGGLASIGRDNRRRS